MPSVKITTYIPNKDYQRLKDKAKQEGKSEYKISQEALIKGLDESPKTPLSVYSTKEILQELWNRIP